VQNRRRVVYYAILLLLILGELLGERNYIIIIFLEYDRGPLHEPWFISEAADEGYIVGPQKKLVAIYAMGEERL